VREPGGPIDARAFTGRSEKAMRQKSDVHVGGKSDGRVIPSKCPHNSGQPLAEGTEGRRPIKENIEQTTARRTQSRISELSGSARCAQGST